VAVLRRPLGRRVRIRESSTCVSKNVVVGGEVPGNSVRDVGQWSPLERCPLPGSLESVSSLERMNDSLDQRFRLAIFFDERTSSGRDYTSTNLANLDVTFNQ